MAHGESRNRKITPTAALYPACPLWQLAPVKAEDGGALADFMMLIPGLAGRPAAYRDQVAASVQAVCASFGRRVAFADLNYGINVLWVSVAAEPGLAGQVAQAIRQQVPEALLIGGQLGAPAGVPVAAGTYAGWRRRARRIVGAAVRLLGAPGG